MNQTKGRHWAPNLPTLVSFGITQSQSLKALSYTLDQKAEKFRTDFLFMCSLAFAQFHDSHYKHKTAS